MDPITGAALIAGGATLIGGVMNRDSQREANEANAAAQERFAREGLQWKVEDAKKAGISPEYALGANTTTFNPTHTSDRSGDMIADAGQSVMRSVLATQDAKSRQTDEALKVETLRGMKLDNDIKQTQFTRVPYTTGMPPFPSMTGNVIEGQGNSPVKDVPMERTGASRSTPHSEGGSIPTVGWGMTHDGGLTPVPSQDIKNRIEDQLVPELTWAGQNLVAPNVGKGPKPPKDALPPGYDYWRWSISRQAYYPSKTERGNKFGDYFRSRKNELKREFQKYYDGKLPLSGRKLK